MTTRRRTPLKHRRGAAAVEFALIAPLFFTVVFALFEFTWLNVVRHTADNAAYEASRVGIVPGATAASVEAEARRILNAVGVRKAFVTVTPSVIDASTDRVTVTIDVPFNSNAIVTPVFADGANLSSSSTLMAERVRTL